MSLIGEPHSWALLPTSKSRGLAMKCLHVLLFIYRMASLNSQKDATALKQFCGRAFAQLRACFCAIAAALLHHCRQAFARLPRHIHTFLSNVCSIAHALSIKCMRAFTGALLQSNTFFCNCRCAKPTKPTKPTKLTKIVLRCQ